MYSESRMCQNGQCTQVGTYARAAGPPGLALWHEPSRQIGRASDDVQTLFYAQPSAGMPDSCMAREWKKSRLGSLPMLPSACASSMSPVASRGGIAIQSWTRWRCWSCMVRIPAMPRHSRVRTKHSRLICMRTWCTQPTRYLYEYTREMTSLNSCILMLNGQQRCRSATTQNKDRHFVDRGRYIQGCKSVTSR